MQTGADVSCLKKKDTTQIMYSQPHPPTSRSTPSDHSSAHPCPRQSVGAAHIVVRHPWRGGAFKLGDASQGSDPPACVSYLFPCARSARPVRSLARSGAHLKYIRPWRRTVLCIPAALTLHAGFLFAVRRTPIHVAAAPRRGCLCLKSKYFPEGKTRERERSRRSKKSGLSP